MISRSTSRPKEPLKSNWHQLVLNSFLVPCDQLNVILYCSLSTTLQRIAHRPHPIKLFYTSTLITCQDLLPRHPKLSFLQLHNNSQTYWNELFQACFLLVLSHHQLLYVYLCYQPKIAQLKIKNEFTSQQLERNWTSSVWGFNSHIVWNWWRFHSVVANIEFAKENVFGSLMDSLAQHPSWRH